MLANNCPDDRVACVFVLLQILLRGSWISNIYGGGVRVHNTIAPHLNCWNPECMSLPMMMCDGYYWNDWDSVARQRRNTIRGFAVENELDNG